jgi:hypothetical protein
MVELGVELLDSIATVAEQLFVAVLDAASVAWMSAL